MFNRGLTYSYIVEKRQVKTLISIFVSTLYASILSLLSNDFFRDRENYILYAFYVDSKADRYSSIAYFFNEPLFIAYNKLLLYVFTPEMVPKVGVFFIAFTFSYFIFKYSKDMLLAILGLLLLFFVAYTFHLQLVVLRQGVATALLLWLVYLFWDKKILFPLIFLLSLIHVSFFIVFFILFYDYILSKYVENIKVRIFWILTTTFIGSFFLVSLGSSLGVRQAESSSLDVSKAGGGGFILFVFVLLFLFFRGFNNVYSDKYGRIAVLGIVAYLALYFTTPISGRLISTFLPFLYIYIVSYKNLKVIFAAIIFLIVNTYLYYDSIVGGSLSFEGVQHLNIALNFN